MDSAGAPIGGLDTAGSPAASSSSVAGGSGSGDAGTNLRSEKGDGFRGSCWSLREVGGGTTTAPAGVLSVGEAGLRAAGSVPVDARVSAVDLRLVGAIAFTGGSVTTAVCPSIVRDGSEERGVT